MLFKQKKDIFVHCNNQYCNVQIIMPMTRCLYCFLIIFVSFLNVAIYAAERNVVINEVMPANVSYIFDYSYNYGGWVELYNTSDNSINLAGYSITDELDSPRKFVFPEKVGNIAAGEFKVIFFDNNDLDTRHVNFKLDCDGAILYLFSNDTTLVSSVEYGYAYPNLSYARQTDGTGVWATCLTPSPGKSNFGGEYSVKRAEPPKVSVEPGIYSRAFVLNITVPSGTIRYTVDGSEPDENSAIWSGYKGINATTILRLRTFKSGYIPSEIITCTYIIEREREFDLPVISIVSDPDNFWNDTIGIYCTGTNGMPGNSVDYNANWNMPWKRPVNVEIFGGKYDEYFSQQCEVSIGGGWSRAYDEKSLELNAEKKYEGKNSFLTRFFVQKPYYRFKSINLRNSGNDFHNSMFSDGMQQSFYAGIIDVDYQAYQPAVHYINGEYFGIINIRERSNHHYVYSNRGYEKENIDLIEQHDNVAFNGDMVALNNMLNFAKSASSSEKYYNKTLEYIDLDEYINYVVIETYSGNTDWMGNNVKFYRNRDKGRFRWILFDTDFGFKDVSYNPFASNGNMSNTGAYVGRIFNNLKVVEDFKEKFINRALAVTGGAMRYDRAENIIDSIKSLISNEIPYHRKRWNKSYNIESYANNFKKFAKERQLKYITYLGEFFKKDKPVKVSIASDVNAPIYINGVEVPTGKFDGYLYARDEYKISVETPYGYKFKHWNVVGGNNDETSNKKGAARKPNIYKTSYNLLPIEGEYILKPVFEKTDSMYGYSVPAVRINELGANKEIAYNDYYEKSDWVELYNLTDTVFDISGLYISNSEENPRLYKIPDKLYGKSRITPHGYCILWADEEPDNRELHLPFKLPSAGGRLILSAYDESDSVLLWRDEIVYSAHNDDKSFGRYPDGSDKLHVMHIPTPGNTNLYSSYNTFVTNDTVTGYHIEDIITSVAKNLEETKEVISVTYYNLKGVETSKNFNELTNGIFIRRTIYDDGSVESEKIIKK